MWYSARLQFRSTIPGDTCREDTVHLIEADSEDEARRKATALGAVERQYFQSPPEALDFEFVGVSDILDLNAVDLSDGMEVWSILLD